MRADPPPEPYYYYPLGHTISNANDEFERLKVVWDEDGSGDIDYLEFATRARELLGPGGGFDEEECVK